MSSWRPKGWDEWKHKTLANLAPAKATITDDILIEQTADAMLEALTAGGAAVKRLPNTYQYDLPDDMVSHMIQGRGDGYLVFIPEVQP